MRDAAAASLGAVAVGADDAHAATAPVKSDAPSQRSEAVFSAPIAATRVGRTRVVAGLVAAEGILRVVGWSDGQPAWTVDAIHDAVWTPDAELRLEPAADGVAVVWRGWRGSRGAVGGKPRGTLVLLGPRGELRGEPVTIGASFCATSDGPAWIDAPASGPPHVRARRWSESAARDVQTLSPERAPALLCGDHEAFVLGDGDDDLTSTSFVPGDPAEPRSAIAIRDADFGDDEEREHDTYTNGDDLGIVRVAGSGEVAMREMSRSGLSPWRRLKHRLSSDDDIVAVDGDGTTTLIVFTHDASDACPRAGSTAESIRALRVDRKTGLDAVVELAPADCDRARGPFWISETDSGPTAAWVERAMKNAQNSAPIAALAFAGFRADAVRAGRVDVNADALVEGGCDGACFAAALVRSPDGDGSQPESIVLLGYP